MNRFDFKGQLAMSAGIAVQNDISEVLLEHVPGAIKIVKSTTAEDRSGTDYWIDHERGTPVSIDCKVRSMDPITAKGRDDLALETVSVIEQNVKGWTLDEKKRTDYILWWFKTTKRWVLVPFLPLVHSFTKRLDLWTSTYDVFKQETKRGSSQWHSECVFVPRREVWAAIYSDFSGSPDVSLQLYEDHVPALQQRGHAIRRHAQSEPPIPVAKPPWTVTCLPCNWTGVDASKHHCAPLEYAQAYWLRRLTWALHGNADSAATILAKPIKRDDLAKLLGDSWLPTGDVA